MNLRLKVPLLLALASAVVFASTGYVAYRGQFEYVEEMRLQQMKTIALTVKSGIEAQARSASAQAEFVANLGSVKEALRAGNREALTTQLGPVFALMTSKKLAEHANFQTPDLKVFLDLEHPDRFGQDVSGHETILRANRYRETQAGVEVNAGGINVRAVAAIGDGATHLGSFEWGVGFARLLDRVKRNSGVELSIAIDTRMLPREALATGSGARASADADSGAPGFKTIVSTNAELVGKILDDEFLAGVQDEVYSTRDYAGVEYGIFAMPLFDFAGRQIGVIGGTRSLKDSLASLRRMRWLFLAATGIGVSLVALGVVLLSNLVLLRPLMRLERDLLQLAEGGLQTPLAEPTRRDEFGSVGRSLNRLREKLLEDERIHADAKLALQAKSARSSRSLS